MRSVVVTGTSTGIGWGTAKVLLAHGFRVFGSVRKQADADRLQQEFGGNFVPLIFDVTDEAAVMAAAATVRAALGGETLAGLVNNAGIAVSGPLLDMPLADFRRQMEVNVIGPVIVTRAFAPLLGADPALKGPPGRIIMISSPGAIKTPIWDKAEAEDLSRYARSPFATVAGNLLKVMLDLTKKALPAEQVGDLVHHALTAPRPKVRYAIVPDPVQQAIIGALPKRLVDRLTAKRLGIVPLPRG
jgi:NAD(P)-dependent dehydrogenase (short-subunit alcohol dehydrogenase family)